MVKFRRCFYNEAAQDSSIRTLHNNPAFPYLLSDVLHGEVFPALRENVIDFYYMGARLCRYTGGKMIWHKNETSPSTNGEYKRIKEACVKPRKNDSPNERASLSVLYRDKEFSPYMSESDQANMILLDIEVGFPCMISNGKPIQNVQVDLLFVDFDTGVLYFIEAKEANDPRVKKTPVDGEEEEALYNRLEVAKQIEKYEANLRSKDREQEVIDAYTNYLEIMERIFNSHFQKKQLSLYPHPKLFVYGESTIYGKKCLKALHFKLGNDLIVKSEAWLLTKKDIIG